MLADYMAAAMRKAKYEILEDDGSIMAKSLHFGASGLMPIP